MNFNFTNQAEYELNTGMTEEMINLYGVAVKYMVIERINRDDTVFGDYSHLKTNTENIFQMNMLPEVSEDWDQTDTAFNQFGLTNYNNVSLFVSTRSLTEIGDSKMIGDLLVFPNNKIMEITDADVTTPGINNLFTFDDAKSVIKITCKPYDFKLINELDNVDISQNVDENEDPVAYETLDTYFQELIDDAVEQDTETQVIPQVTTVVPGTVDTKVQKPIIDKSEDDIFGNF